MSCEAGEDAAREEEQSDLSAGLNFAHAARDRHPQPLRDCGQETDNHKERFLTLEEVKRFGEGLRELEKDGTNCKALDIMRLWMLDRMLPRGDL